jgi:AcrR family transcriptional regulator
MTMVTFSGRRALSKAASRRRIIDSAIRLFGDRGIDVVTVDDIATAADVGKGTIYNYFRTKEDIVVAFMTEFEREVQTRLHDFDTARRPLVECLTEFIRLQFRLKQPHHHFVRVFFAQMFLQTGTFMPAMAEIHQLTQTTTRAFLAALQKRGAIRADVNLDDATLVLINVQLGLSALWAIEGPPFTGTEYAVQREVAMLCEGLKARRR